MNKRILLPVMLLTTVFQARADWFAPFFGTLLFGSVALQGSTKESAAEVAPTTIAEKITAGFNSAKDTYWTHETELAAQAAAKQAVALAQSAAQEAAQLAAAQIAAAQALADEVAAKAFAEANAPFYTKAVKAISKAVPSQEAIKNFSGKTWESAQENKFYILGAVAVAAGLYGSYKLYNYVNQPVEDEEEEA